MGQFFMGVSELKDWKFHPRLGVPRVVSRIIAVASLTLVLVILPTLAYAYGGADDYEEPTARDFLFELARSSFGTLVMVFCGFGGFATIYMQRTGRSGQQIPMLGIAMLLVAIAIFVFRMMITSGMLGQQYLDFGR